MIPISKFEEAVATTPTTGVCVPRQRLMTARGWVYTIHQPIAPKVAK